MKEWLRGFAVDGVIVAIRATACFGVVYVIDTPWLTELRWIDWVGIVTIAAVALKDTDAD